MCDAFCVTVCMCMCAAACAHKCVRPRACEKGAVCVCDVAHVDIAQRTHVCTPLHVPVCAVVCWMCAREETHGGCKQGHPPVASGGIACV